MRIKAAVLAEMGRTKPYSQSQPLKIESLELDQPKRGELLVKVLAAGLCHSDLSVINGSRPRPLPMALGHEGVGEVVALGPDTEGFSIGDRVVFCFVPICGRCQYCAQGRAALCEAGAKSNAAGELTGGGCRLHKPDSDAKMHHHLGVSAFAEMAVVSSGSVVRIDRNIPVEVAAIFGCAVLTGVGAVVNTAAVAPGQSVAILAWAESASPL
jgi:Zn-dependent alcohol dehydrogenase